MFEIIKINCVASFLINKIVSYHFTSIISDWRIKTVIDRCLDDYFVTGYGHGLNNSRDCRNYSACIDNPLRIYFPLMAVYEPFDYCIIIILRYFGVTEDSVFHSSSQSFDNCRSCAEVHICYPHRQYILFLRSIPFIGVCPATRDYFIKIVFHNLYF